MMAHGPGCVCQDVLDAVSLCVHGPSEEDVPSQWGRTLSNRLRARIEQKDGRSMTNELGIHLPPFVLLVLRPSDQAPGLPES